MRLTKSVAFNGYVDIKDALSHANADASQMCPPSAWYELRLQLSAEIHVRATTVVFFCLTYR